MNKNVLTSGLIGGIAFFLLGWLIYGILLADFMTSQTTMDISRPEEEMIMWALLLANLAWGFLLAWLFSNMSNVNSWMDGLQKGAIIGFLTAVMFDMIFYATSTIFALKGAFVDMFAFAIMSGIGGAIIAGLQNRNATAKA